jgi:uncharacterized protein YxjI
MAINVSDIYGFDRYIVRRQFFKLFGAAFHIYDETQTQVLFYSKQKAFKLREDIRLYTGEDMQTELLTIQARQVMDWGASYDVYDAIERRKVGALRRKAMSSIVRDQWIILDVNDQPIGQVQEDSLFKALLRRFVELVTLFLPQSYTVEVGGSPVGVFTQNFNPFVQKITVDFSVDSGNRLDRRLGIAAAVLMCAIEGRQS